MPGFANVENEHAGKDFHFQLLSGEIAAKKRSRRLALKAAMERRGAGREKPRYSFLYRILSGRSRMRSAFIFNRCLATLIVLCVVAFVLESVPAFSSSKAAVEAFCTEAASSCIFWLNIWHACGRVEARRYRMMSPWQARLHYVWTMRTLVDLVSCLPFS